MTQPDPVLKLYVEGTLDGVANLKVTWQPTGWFRNLFAPVSDSIKITTFTFHGPHNVPNYSIYSYSASGVPANPGESQWTPQGDAAIVNASTPNQVDVKWGAGATIGRLSFAPSSQYSWDFEANVVKITIDAPDGAEPFATRQVSTGAVRTGGGLPVRIPWRASDDLDQNADPLQPGMKFSAKITMVGAGPNQDRGVKFMDVGFTQQVTTDTVSADYDNYHSLYWTPPAGTALPLRDSATTTTAWFDPRNSAVVTNGLPNVPQTISADDTPRMYIPAYYNQATAAANGQDALIRTHILKQFILDVSARTNEFVDGLRSKVYTRLATNSWEVVGNGTGGFDNGGTYIWTPEDDAGVFSGSQWNLLTDGSQFDMSGPIADDVLPKSKWQP
jgi:hypothetical protein